MEELEKETEDLRKESYGSEILQLVLLFFHTSFLFHLLFFNNIIYLLNIFFVY